VDFYWKLFYWQSNWVRSSPFNVNKVNNKNSVSSNLILILIKIACLSAWSILLLSQKQNMVLVSPENFLFFSNSESKIYEKRNSFMWKLKLFNKSTYTTCTSGVGVSGATQFTVTINFSVASTWVAEFYANKIWHWLQKLYHKNINATYSSSIEAIEGLSVTVCCKGADRKVDGGVFRLDHETLEVAASTVSHDCDCNEIAK
jgi:hypothetical protein